MTISIVFQIIRSSFQGDYLLVGWIFSRCILAHFQRSLQGELFKFVCGIKLMNQTVSSNTSGRGRREGRKKKSLIFFDSSWGQRWWSVCGFKINKLIWATKCKSLFGYYALYFTMSLRFFFFFKETASSGKQCVHMWFLEVLIFKALGEQPAALRVALCKIRNIRILMKFCSFYLLWHFSLCAGDSGGNCEVKYTYLFHSKLEVSICYKSFLCLPQQVPSWN